MRLCSVTPSVIIMGDQHSHSEGLREGKTQDRVKAQLTYKHICWIYERKRDTLDKMPPTQ